MTDKVSIGIIYGTMHPKWVWSLLAIQGYDLRHQRYTDHPRGFIGIPGTNPATQRNAAVREFLLGDGDWLFFIDCDETPPADILHRLVESADPTERPIVSALVFAEKHVPHYRIVPACVGIQTVEPLVCHEYAVVPTGQHWHVGAAGAGALLIHRSVLEKMGEANKADAFPWFKWMQTEGENGPDVLGEDYSFGLRAAALGFPTYVDTSIVVGHVKDRVLGPRDFWAQVPYEIIPPTPVAVIPTKGKAQARFKKLVRALDCPMFVMDNGMHGALAAWCEGRPNVTVIDCPNMGIHQMWNLGAAAALSSFPKVDIAFLNDDIGIEPGFIDRLATELRSDEKLIAVCPNWNANKSPVDILKLEGIAANGKNPTGLCGWAFMVRGEWFERFQFPENCMWWYGDNDLTMTADLTGFWYGMVTDVPVVHDNGTTGDWDSPAMQEVLARDRANWVQNWSERGIEVGAA